jgi:FHA domain
MPSLIICPRKGDVYSFALPDTRIGIGRSPTNSLVLADDYCSPSHASVYPVPGAYAIQDMGSKNGTWVNSRQIEKETELHPRDEIMVGATRIYFVSGEGRRPYSSEHTWTPRQFAASGGTTIALVDNRVFMLGLNELYRDAMKQFESSRLLQSARGVATALHVTPGRFPIEGYYADTPKLREYYCLMRTLQELDKTEEDKVRGLFEFQFLTQVMRSPLFGRTKEGNKLLPRAVDSLAQALLDCRPAWSLNRLVKAAYEDALRYNDCSLVGLAARTQDAIILTATRESTVLYAEVICLGLSEEPQIKYEWTVDDSLAKAANILIETFNGFVPGALPKAEPVNAGRFYGSYSDSEFIGRCVRIAMTPDHKEHYHWAIALIRQEESSSTLGVDEFWSGTIWTTERYRQAQGDPAHMQLFSEVGVPQT